jgi:hypothetical protein
MKKFQDLLKELHACSDACEWAGEMTIEEVVEKCHRGDWLLWLAKRANVDDRKLILAKGHCANTFRYLMKDQRNIAAVDAVIKYGNGEITRDELNQHAAAADAYVDAVERSKNLPQTAVIYRMYIGQEIIDNVNKLLV